MRRWLVAAFVFCFVLTFGWHFKLLSTFKKARPAMEKIRQPGEGELETLPSQVLAARKLLETEGVSEFMASAKMWEWEGGVVLQRLGEGLYPRRLVLKSPWLIAFATEQLPAGCTRRGKEQDVHLVHCGS